MSEQIENNEQFPAFWDHLQESDKQQYNIMKTLLSSSQTKNRRNKSAETFQDVLDTIKLYVVRGDDNDLYRGIVCGIYWINDDIVINTRQLRLLLDKCKSSINGSFQMIGYLSPSSSTDTTPILSKTFPFWKDNFKEIRQWTIRAKPKSSTRSPKVLVKQYLEKTTLMKKESPLSQLVRSNDFETPPPDIIPNDNQSFELTIADSPMQQEEINCSSDIDLDTTSEQSYDVGNDSFGFWEVPYEEPFDM